MTTTFPPEQPNFKFQHASPLDSLVRKTSKRARAAVQSTTSHQYPFSLIDSYSTMRTSQDEDEGEPYGGYVEEFPLTLPRHPLSQQQSPTSPLLHGHFARQSVATVSGSYTDTRTSMDSRNAYQELEYRYHDDESIYSQNDPPPPAIRDSWRSGVSSRSTRPYDPDIPTSSKFLNHNSNPQPPAMTLEPPRSQQWTSVVPTVVVSSPDVDNSGNRSGRAPVVRPITSNFSRPVRPSQPDAPQQVTAPPPLPPNSDEQKRRVLERNATRATSQTPPQESQQQMKFFHRSTPPAPNPNPYLSMTDNHTQQLRYEAARHIPPVDPLPNPYAERAAIPPLQINRLNKPNPEPHLLNTTSTSQPTRNRRPSPQPSDQHSDRRPPQPSSVPQSNGNRDMRSHLAPITLPRHPPTRSDSPASLYSAYSYYNYEGAVPSPVGSDASGRSSRASPVLQPPTSQPQGSQHLQPIPPQNGQTRSRIPTMRSPSPIAAEPQTPQDFLQLGIQNHEANRLGEAAIYFEKSAKENGGCGVGMLMWGLTLRHGWGCEKNEKVGFKWLRKAAEHAVVDLESARGGQGVDAGPVQEELVLAIYEVGQCFFHGWGVSKDQKMAVSYYTVAARLGDPDAQNDLAFCLANGKGCKKDRKEAAKWYRAAVAQGVSDVGLAWIYKEKFM
ncbi:hypothetical protein P691DRAFT_813499 [Macrolepiota fuliginosa MF-IS2]|uniref:HCP-like protein n=1 Tax=Macrolepiota fuliginosa MF-IS2 TaxID=1400762 RepID=A0A9P5XFH3_9AGAR|nr:hypothetical protein P691DRAFT_813499 [Macrolepiota fuliginosa MF-IS2]